MKNWARWQDYVVVAVGIYTAFSVLWTPQGGMSTGLMVIAGGFLFVSGVVNLAMPGLPAAEWAQIVFGLFLFLSPWIGSYTEQTAASWTCWIGGAIVVAVSASAIKPSIERSHHRMPSH